MGLDPAEAYNNVGFRCVPLGVEAPTVASFCAPTYTQLCRDPNRDPNDCTPPTVGDGDQPAGDDFELTGFGCPGDNGWVTITIDGPIGDDHTVNVGGYDFQCMESGLPDRWLCSGPHPPEGTITTVTVCPDGGQANNGNNLVAYQLQMPGPEAPALQAYVPAKQDNGNQLVAYQAAQIAQPELQAFEPPNGDSQGLVAYQSATNTACPEGYIYNPTTGQCEQDPNGSCPEGWSYNPTTYQCEPPQDGCPEGTSYNADQQGCTPDTGEECPDGYNYVAASNTCEPPSNDDGGGACPAGYYFDQKINCCSPIVDDGCDEGSYRSAETNQCEPLDQDGCPDGYSYNSFEGACAPDPGENPNGEGCNEGFVLNDAGECVPAEGSATQQEMNEGCGEGGYYDPNLQTCVFPGDECGPGYYRSENTDTCLPIKGPNSGCPLGYAYEEAIGCCVETPGNDGSVCPGTTAAADYDYVLGYCDPIDGQPCPSGYMYDEQQNGCVPVPTTDGLPQTVDGCPEGTTYNEQLGYCVQDQCGCPLGTYMNTDTNQCEPYGGGEQDGCWSYTVSVPECPFITPTPHPECDNDEQWNPDTQKCEGIPEEEVTPVACSSFSDPNSCTAAGCRWQPSDGAAYCY
jgi:hypothetical protein